MLMSTLSCTSLELQDFAIAVRYADVFQVQVLVSLITLIVYCCKVGLSGRDVTCFTDDRSLVHYGQDRRELWQSRKKDRKAYLVSGMKGMIAYYWITFGIAVGTYMR